MCAFGYCLPSSLSIISTSGHVLRLNQPLKYWDRVLLMPECWQHVTFRLEKTKGGAKRYVTRNGKWCLHTFYCWYNELAICVVFLKVLKEMKWHSPQWHCTVFHAIQLHMFRKLINMAEINRCWFYFTEPQVMYESWYIVMSFPYKVKEFWVSTYSQQISWELEMTE
jgi:hypothetical protein